jgi:hypothetical protein
MRPGIAGVSVAGQGGHEVAFEVDVGVVTEVDLDDKDAGPGVFGEPRSSITARFWARSSG